MACALDQVFRCNDNFVFRRIEGETILVPIRANVGDLDCLYSLNTVGARIWESLDGARDLGAVRDRLVAEYDVDAGEAGADLLAFVREMASIDALIPVESREGNRTHG
jgi:hypothetical protein